jgi:SsrA-binding protein
MKEDAIKIVARNRKAAHDYHLSDHIEAGLVLRGTEIKSVRAGQVSLRESYVQTDGREAWLVNAHIAPYDPASRTNHDPRRPRKLLLHKRQIRNLADQVQQRGYTIIPTRMYIVNGRAKLEIALAKGKRKYDKRKAIAERDAERQIDRALRRRSRGR